MLNESQKVNLSFEHSESVFLPFDRINEIKLSDYMMEIIRDVNNVLKKG